MPSASTEPGMSSTPSMRLMRKSSPPGATGAKPTLQLPKIAVVTPCHELGRQFGVPGGLAVVVRVHVDPSGQHQEAGGVDLAAAGFGDGPDLGDELAVDGHVGRERFGAGAVDDGPTPDDDVVHAGSPCIEPDAAVRRAGRLTLEPKPMLRGRPHLRRSPPDARRW